MINVGNSSIENILIGTTQVDKVYLGTDVVWEHVQPVTKNYLKFTAVGQLKMQMINNIQLI